MWKSYKFLFNSQVDPIQAADSLTSPRFQRRVGMNDLRNLDADSTPLFGARTLQVMTIIRHEIKQRDYLYYRESDEGIAGWVFEKLLRWGNMP